MNGMKCEYKDCKAEAKFKLGLADPDVEGSYYCRGHVDIRKQEIAMEIFGWKGEKCIVITGRNQRCLNDKKFGDYCGIHIRNWRNQK